MKAARKTLVLQGTVETLESDILFVKAFLLLQI